MIPPLLYIPHDISALYRCKGCKRIMYGVECRTYPFSTDAGAVIGCATLGCRAGIEKVQLEELEPEGKVS